MAAAANWLGPAAAGGMFLVLVMGATVTDTGSAQGCGRDWPLCNGHWVPEFAVTAAIEFSHRAVTVLESVLVLALAAVALRLQGDRRPVQLLTPLMVFALLTQAALGAAAVKWPQQPSVLALHFGVSLVALASTTLVAVLLKWPSALSGASLPGGLRLGSWGLLAYLYGLVYTGAYVRHLGAAGACPGWPLCSLGGFHPENWAVAANLVHRGAAAGAVALASALLIACIRLPAPRPDLVSGATVLLAALVAQAGSGAFGATAGWGLWAELLHAALTGVAFTAAAYLCLRSTLRAQQAETESTTQPRLRAGATP